jgi:hypothetical protein
VTTYYVSSSGGSDSNAGTSTAAPWQNMTKLYAQTFQPGDSVLLKRGDTWFDSMYINKGSGSVAYGNITFGAYGVGADPIISGAAPKVSGNTFALGLNTTAEWTNVNGNVWRTASTIIAPQQCTTAKGWEPNVLTMVLNDGAAIGRRVSSQGSCTAQGYFYYDTATDYIYMYSTSNPASYYTKIEAARDFWGICLTEGRSRFTFQDITIRCFSMSGVCIGDAETNWMLERLNVQWCGGGVYSSGSSPTGNGIVVFNAVDSVIRDCFIDEIWETGISLQLMGGVGTINGLDCYRNIIRNTGRAAFDTWFDASGYSMTDGWLCHNTIVGNGDGYLAEQRNAGGAVNWGSIIVDDRSGCTFTGMKFMNNIGVGDADQDYFYEVQQETYLSGWTFDNNLVKATTNAMYIDAGSHAGNNTWVQWQTNTSQDAHSIGISTDPMLNSDYTLQAGSPCIGAAGNDGLGLHSDIGAVAYAAAGAPTINTILPNSGTTAGGTSVTIGGTVLSGASVTFGGSSATGVTATATQITCTTPAHAAGAVNVVVTTSGGTATSTGGYTYTEPGAPVGKRCAFRKA